MVLLISVSTSPSLLSATFVALTCRYSPFVTFVVGSCIVLTIYEKAFILDRVMTLVKGREES